jgi:hypothetical protein
LENYRGVSERCTTRTVDKGRAKNNDDQLQHDRYLLLCYGFLLAVM